MIYESVCHLEGRHEKLQNFLYSAKFRGSGMRRPSVTSAGLRCSVRLCNDKLHPNLNRTPCMQSVTTMQSELIKLNFYAGNKAYFFSPKVSIPRVRALVRVVLPARVVGNRY